MKLLKDQHFDALAVGVIDFNKSSFETFEINLSPNQNSLESGGIFDLASLTKPLTLSFSKLLDPDCFNEKMNLLLNHKGSLPAIGRLSPQDFEKQINRFKIKEAATNYSDLGAIRLQFEIEKALKQDLYTSVEALWDKNLYHWTQLKDFSTDSFRATGFRKGKVILGEVNDDNAFNLKSRLSNAGLFSTIDSLSNTLIKANSHAKLLESMKTSFKSNTSQNRFVEGWDTVSNPNDTLAGKGCSAQTFGHLGFTGTSIWIDLEIGIGHIILTNATKNYWYDRSGLTTLRKTLGESIWSNFR